MNITEAIDKAKKFTEGATFHAGSEGWKTVMAVLLAEVERLDEIRKELAFQADNGPEPCRDNEPQGPLPTAILAGEIDDAAEKLADLAKEIDIYNGLKYEEAIKEIGTFKVALVLFAKQLREEV